MRSRAWVSMLCVLLVAVGTALVPLTISTEAGATARTPYCAALLRVLTIEAGHVQNSMTTAINQKPQRPLTSSMKSARYSLVKTVSRARTFAPNNLDASSLKKYRSQLEAATTPRPLIETIWAFDATGSRIPLLACKGQYKTLATPSAPF
jgi:hypothetical protein